MRWTRQDPNHDADKHPVIETRHQWRDIGRSHWSNTKPLKKSDKSPCSTVRIIVLVRPFPSTFGARQIVPVSTQPRKCTTSSGLRTTGSFFGFFGSGIISSKVHRFLSVTL